MKINPLFDADGVPWCKVDVGPSTHQCPAYRRQRCEAGGRPWGVCTPAVRQMAAALLRVQPLALADTARLLPCGHVPDTYHDHMAICSRCEE